MRNPEVPIIFPNGIASGDYDQDGDIDLFIVRGNIGGNLLYRNEGNLTFVDVAQSAGVAHTRTTTESDLHGSPAFADMDGDGDLDLLLTGLDGDITKVYSNNGDGTFADVTNGSGLDFIRAVFTHSPAFGDYDLDGDLDLMFGHWGTPRDFVNGPGDTEHLWRNDSANGQIKYTSVSVEAGIAPSIITNTDPMISQRVFDNTFGATFARVDDDEFPDILVVADFNFSQVFMNNGDGTFDNATDFSVIIDGNGMGSAVGDYDGDGDLDWFVSSILADGPGLPSTLSRIGNRLYRNDWGVFADATEISGVEDGGWGWGSCFADLDNDGHLDIYHTNGWPEHDEYGGFPTDVSRAFMSNGDGTFTERAAELGLDDTEQGRGVVCADLDGDGDVDIVQMHANQTNAVTLWENELNDGANFLTVKLEGALPNSDAIGARVSVVTGPKTQIREINLGNNFASHNPAEAYFGFGDETDIDSLIVRWPDGQETTLLGPAMNQRLIIRHPDR